ncbi:small membrane protein [Cenarchaeum symbiosum A]|uniref:Small membrane protein n=1 Tax=Cenarchaeum symbiosum (strain A) TaxID=414004 RepID=A0RU48_CENSY|nr:small membrane protein [Cenarchaeum symbiosum A]
MLVPLLIISEFVFYEPYLIGHVPAGTELSLVLIVVLAGLSGLIIPMNIHRMRMLGASRKSGSWRFSGSVVGAMAGACGCGPVGFALFSTFGSVGAAASAFLTNYEVPIRAAAIAVLLLAYFTTVKSLKTECKTAS